jgi:tRNA threonylcarbamoyl adenosine modification protein YeaZ
MPTLALEFSSSRRSVAVLSPSGEAVATNTDREKSTRAFALIQEALHSARVDRTEIQCIAVGLGPGSYTGIRVAISIAQGWQLAKQNVQLLGVSSADVLTESARAHGLKGRGTCVIDAQRKEFYVATCDLGANPARILETLHLETAQQVAERARRGETLFGPEENLPGNRLVFPDPLVLARLTAGRTDFVRGEQLEPIYLRETSFVKAPPPRVSSAA